LIITCQQQAGLRFIYCYLEFYKNQFYSLLQKVVIDKLKTKNFIPHSKMTTIVIATDAIN